jgi:hypothetical protein
MGPQRNHTASLQESCVKIFPAFDGNFRAQVIGRYDACDGDLAKVTIKIMQRFTNNLFNLDSVRFSPNAKLTFSD